MRFISILFFILSFPFIVFYFTVLSGGVTADGIKSSLVRSNIYEIAATNLTDGLKAENDFADNDVFSKLISEYINADYIKSKTEKVIDDSSSWILGGDKIPELSFRDIKTSIESDNPAFFEELNQLNDEAKNQYTDQEGQFSDSSTSNIDPMSELIKNDFTFPLDKQLKFLKDLRVVLLVLLPVTIFFIFVSIITIWLRTPTLIGRFKWLGSAFVLSSINGFVLMVISGLLVQALAFSVKGPLDFPINIFVPIIQNLVEGFVLQFKNNLLIANIFAAVIGLIFLILGFLKKPLQNSSVNAKRNVSRGKNK